MTANRRVILLTGLSGAGKTTATKSLEDIGFRTIDNLPYELLPALVEKIAADPQRFARVCLVVDARDGDPSRTIELVRTGAASIGVSARIIYLDARDDVLIRRFSETRHRHPLGGAVDAPRSVAEAIAAERRLLSATREAADAVIDTSDLSGRELRDRLVAEALESEERVAIRLTSFGYKHGIPLEADLSSTFAQRRIPTGSLSCAPSTAVRRRSATSSWAIPRGPRSCSRSSATSMQVLPPTLQTGVAA